MYWKVKNNINETYYLMHIKDDIYTKISKRDIKKVLNINNVRQSWFINVNGYISTTFRTDSKVNNIYLHQLIMDVHNEDLTNYEKTVDHINQDKLDNRQTNLRLVNMSTQNTNKGKAKRRVDACDLPEELDESLPKYVVYRKEILDKNRKAYLEQERYRFHVNKITPFRNREYIESCDLDNESDNDTVIYSIYNV